MLFALENRFGWEVVEATSFEEALKKCTSETQQVRILVDADNKLDIQTVWEIAKVERWRMEEHPKLKRRVKRCPIGCSVSRHRR